jgi:hypothetical protein
MEYNRLADDPRGDAASPTHVPGGGAEFGVQEPVRTLKVSGDAMPSDERRPALFAGELRRKEPASLDLNSWQFVHFSRLLTRNMVRSEYGMRTSDSPGYFLPQWAWQVDIPAVRARARGFE